VTNLSDVVQLISDTKSDLQTLQQAGAAAVHLIQGTPQKLGRAQDFANAMDQPFTADPADRAAGIQAEIDSETAALAAETDPLNRMRMTRHIANLQLLASAEGMSTALSGVVAFSPDEVVAIQALLTQAQKDIAARQDLATAISVLTSIVTASAQIAGKVATSGLV
jgi:hypothetical protein